MQIQTQIYTIILILIHCKIELQYRGGGQLEWERDSGGASEEADAVWLWLAGDGERGGEAVVAR